MVPSCDLYLIVFPVDLLFSYGSQEFSWKYVLQIYELSEDWVYSDRSKSLSYFKWVTHTHTEWEAPSLIYFPVLDKLVFREVNTFPGTWNSHLNLLLLKSNLPRRGERSPDSTSSNFYNNYFLPPVPISFKNTPGDLGTLQSEFNFTLIYFTLFFIFAAPVLFASYCWTNI